MGYWGAGLYANDTGADVRDAYMTALQDGLDDETSWEKVQEKFREYIGTDEEPLFWYAAADTQWRLGRLRPEVKAKAMEWLERQGGLELWVESTSKGKGWIKTMQQLRQRLESPMPKWKKVTKPKEINQDPWKLHDVYAYQFHTEESKENGTFGKYILLQKIGAGYNAKAYDYGMSVQIFDRLFDELPTIDEVYRNRILPFDFPNRNNISADVPSKWPKWPQLGKKKDPIWMNTTILSHSTRGYPKKWLTYLGNTEGPENKMKTVQAVMWCHLEIAFPKFQNLWKNEQYESLGNGIFDYWPKR